MKHIFLCFYNFPNCNTFFCVFTTFAASQLNFSANTLGNAIFENNYFYSYEVHYFFITRMPNCFTSEEYADIIIVYGFCDGKAKFP